MRSFFLSFLVALLVVTPAFALTPDDTYYDDQWYLEHIGVPDVWDVTTGSQEVVVAVLDTASI